VFWQVGSSATLGTTSSLTGNILALTSITLTTGAAVSGRTLARNGAVTLDSNTVNPGTCAVVVPPAGCPAVSVLPATLPNGTVGTAYAQTLTGSGGTAPYTFGVTAGALPAGLVLAPTGTITGSPTTAGSTAVTIRATDSLGCFAERAYTMVIAAATCPVVTFNPATLPNATVGDAYTQTLTGSGGTAPYTFAVTVGTLPAGLTLTAAGALSGTPTTAGSSEVTIRVTDANNCFADRVLTIVVTTAVPTLPQAFVALLGVGLTAVGYYRLRRRARRQL
jgi:hypothetical protein